MEIAELTTLQIIAELQSRPLTFVIAWAENAHHETTPPRYEMVWAGFDCKEDILDNLAFAHDAIAQLGDEPPSDPVRFSVS